MAKTNTTPTWLKLALEEIAQRAYNRAMREIPDKEKPPLWPERNISPLKKGMKIIIESPKVARIYIPHYWAVYVHDGYRPFKPAQASVLIWFRRPTEDPRLTDGAMPERWSQVKHLTKEQFLDILERNKIADKNGQLPVAYIAPMLPGKIGTRFFDNDAGFKGFVDEANAAANPIVRQGILDELKDIMHVKDSATATLRF